MSEDKGHPHENVSLSGRGDEISYEKAQRQLENRNDTLKQNEKHQETVRGYKRMKIGQPTRAVRNVLRANRPWQDVQTCGQPGKAG